MSDQELQQLKEIQMKQLKGMFVTPTELSAILKVIMKVMKDIRTRMNSEMDKGDGKMTAMHKEMMGQMKEVERNCMDMIKEMRKKGEKDIEAIQNRVMRSINDIKASIPTMPDLSVLEAKISDVEAKIPVIKDTILDTPEQLRDKLETLKDDERLDKSAIKGLKEEIDELKRELSTRLSGGSRRVYQPYVDDFSGETNGITKTFYLSREPLKTNAVTVFGTDFPTILRPSIDFTVAGKTLTLTDEVPSPSQGATLICTFFA